MCVRECVCESVCVRERVCVQIDMYKLLMVLTHRTLEESEEASSEAIARVQAIPEAEREDEVPSVLLPPPFMSFRLAAFRLAASPPPSCPSVLLPLPLHPSLGARRCHAWKPFRKPSGRIRYPPLHFPTRPPLLGQLRSPVWHSTLMRPLRGGLTAGSESGPRSSQGHSRRAWR